MPKIPWAWFIRVGYDDCAEPDGSALVVSTFAAWADDPDSDVAADAAVVRSQVTTGPTTATPPPAAGVRLPEGLSAAVVSAVEASSVSNLVLDPGCHPVGSV